MVAWLKRVALSGLADGDTKDPTKAKLAEGKRHTGNVGPCYWNPYIPVIRNLVGL